MLTPNFFATSLALTSWRMGWLSLATGGKKAPWSLPFKRCMAHPIQTDRLDMSSI